jgi:hypothetical protein
MEVIYPCCAGLDVHKDTVVACARIVTGNEVRHHVETFVTSTTGLLAQRRGSAAVSRARCDRPSPRPSSPRCPKRPTNSLPSGHIPAT